MSTALVKKSEMQLLNLKNETHLSIYQDEPLTRKVAGEQFARLKKVYGNKLPDGFMDELSDSLRRHKFTNKRLIESVDNLIDTNEFPSVDKILSAGSKLRLFGREEFLRETKGFSDDYKKYYKAVNIDDQLYYVHKRQLEYSGVTLPEWVKPTQSKTKITGEYKDGKKVERKPFNILEYYDQLMNGEIE